MFTSPARVDGTYVVDAVLGDWLASKYGKMEDHPLTVEIEDSRIGKVPHDVFTVPSFCRRVPAHTPACPVTRRAKRQIHTCRSPC